MDTTPKVQLAALKDLPDYRVCADDPDPRGWNVIDTNDILVGTVSDLIVDPAGLIARYIVCSVTRGATRSVLIPTGFVRLDKDNSIVQLDFVTAADVDQLPAFTGLPLSTEETARLEKVITGVAPPTTTPSKIVRRTESGDASQ